jgi:GAF domain-containing protein
MGESVTKLRRRGYSQLPSLGPVEDTQEIVVGSLIQSLGRLEAPQSDADIMEILERILMSALITVHAKDGSLLVRDDDTNELVFAIVQGERPNNALLWRKIPPGKGIASWVAEHRCAAIVNDTGEDSRFYGGLDQELAYATHSILAAPIVFGDELLGVIEVLNKRNSEPFNERDKDRLTELCNVAGEILGAMIRQMGRDDGPARIDPVGARAC